MDDVIRPARGVAIPVSELEWRFSASSGPGGQHANTSNTKAEVRFDIAGSPSLSDGHRARLIAKLGTEVRAVSQSERSQTRNRQLALDRLGDRIAAALVVQTPRRATRATKGSKERRLQSKSQRSQVKRERQRPSRDD